MIIKRKGALGDLIMLTPAIRQLRLNNPDVHIAVETWFPDVFQNSPYVSEVSRKIMRRNEEIVELDALYEMNLDRHPIDTYARALLGTTNMQSKFTELFITENDRLWVDKWMSNNIVVKDKKIVVVHFGITWVPILGEEFERLLDYLRKEYVVILVGKRIPDKEYYPKNLDNIINLVDQEWSIHKLHWLIQKADLFFGTDTGVMHIATTTNTPIVCCYSFVNPMFRCPFRDCIEFRAVEPLAGSCDTLFCAETHKKLCANGDFAGVRCHNDFSCAKSITSDMMIQQIKSIKMPFLENINE